MKRYALYGALAVGVLMAAQPALGQAPPIIPNTAVTPLPSPLPGSSPLPGATATPGGPGALPGEGVSTNPSVRPMVPPSPNGSPVPTPTPAPNESPTPKPTKIQTRSDAVVNKRQEGITTLRGNVHVDYGKVVIDSEELAVNTRTHELMTDTKFKLEQPDPKNPGQRQVLSGTGLRYNYETEESTVYDANLSTPAEYPGQVVYIRAKEVKGQGDSRFDCTDAVFSTCSEILDEKVPHYHVESRSLQYFAGDRIVAWDNKIYINGRYTFYLPVWVIPLKQERYSLDAGRNDVEGFYVRFPYDYSLPSLVNGYLTNNGRLYANYFEKKGPALGVENTTHWGYYATTYGFFYGLVNPDKGNLLPVNDERDQAVQDDEVKLGSKLLGLNGLPFQDHQWGLEHRQRIWGDLEAGGRFEDHNIYDPLTPNYRNNRQIQRFDLKDAHPELGSLNYNIGYDSSEQRGTQTRSGNTIINQVSQSQSQRLNGNASFKAVNTNVRLSSDISRQHTSQIFLKKNGADGNPDPNNPELDTQDGGGNVNITNNLSASSEWPGGIQSNLTMPYRIDFRETPAPTPVPSGAAPAAPTPTASPSPWNQNIEPTLDVTDRIQGVGTLSLQASKFFDLTQQPAASPLPLDQQITAVKNQGRFDKLPEITLTSDPFLANLQPFTLKLGYGRYFEYSSFNKNWLPSGFSGPLDRYFPGPYINRLNPEATLSSKAQDIGFKSTLDFGGSGYRQFFYSTLDAQYSIDERLRLSTSWTDKVQTNFNYTNNLTPDPKDFGGGGPNTPTNSSPFNQDKLSLTKQTHLTGDFSWRNEPWWTYTFNSGYDYQNKQYDTFQNQLSWRTALPYLDVPIGLTLNGQFQPEKVTPERIAELHDPNLQVGGLRLESKTFDINYLPKFPTYGIAGMWLPVSGTFTVRSTPDMFGGAFGSDSILPGWQFDNQMSYDFEKGQWQSLVNRVYFTFGHSWHDHLELMLGGYYDTTPTDRGYKFTTIGLSKDLHDFILSFQYDRLSSFYSISLTMVAFPSKPLNFTSNSFNRTGQPGGAAFPGVGF